MPPPVEHGLMIIEGEKRVNRLTGFSRLLKNAA
jgi:hypothetical protein